MEGYLPKGAKGVSHAELWGKNVLEGVAAGAGLRYGSTPVCPERSDCGGRLAGTEVREMQ